MNDTDILLISFSGGRSSAYMTARLLAERPLGSVITLFANTGKERPETLDYVQACQEHWNHPITWLEYDPVDRFRIVDYTTASRAGEPFAALIDKKKYLPNVVARFCTQELKIRVMKRYMQSLGYRHWTSAIGIRYDEPRRWSKTRGIGERECWDTWLPLVDWRITKEMVLAYWRAQPFDLRLASHEGNCDLCFLKGKHKLKKIITDRPGSADWWIVQEQKTGGTFNKHFSVSTLVAAIRRSPTLFDYDDGDFECFCNVD